MKRLGLNLEDQYVAWKYQNNTVIIGYEKPDKVLELEMKKKSDVQAMGMKDGGFGSS